jgi:hypothetical protein
MKKADNFNPAKWLVENKITFQSKLNEIERMPDTDYEDNWEKGGGMDDEEADLLAASIMKKGAPIPGYEDQTYLSDTLVGEDGEEFGNYRIYNTYEEAVDAAGTNIYTLDDKYAVTFPDTESKSEFYGKFDENQINESSSDKMLELVKMYVANFYDGGYDSAEIALEKIDKILNGDLDDYDKAFLKGEEDNY